MKKTLVALAALATVSAAFAQTSVNLYGRIDASIGSMKTSVGGVTTVDPGIQIMTSRHSGSRWGMRGSEDLGGGLRAIFQLEQGFNIDNGGASAAANQFHRAAMVGVSGGFGALTVGRQYDMVNSSYANYDALVSGYAAQTVLNGNCATGVGDCVVRQNNSVQYKTPAMGGFNLTAMWAPGENKAPGFSAGNMFGLYANYANGPLDVGAMWQTNKAGGGAAAVENHMLGASYDLGMAKVYAQYAGGTNKPTAGKDQGYNVGVLIPLGAPRLAVSYARENRKIAGLKNADATGISLLGTYPLSKRTYVYAAFLRTETDPVAVGVATTKQQNYGLGLVHNF